ncbi:MAG: hypothetical protein R3F56_05580 [Planctomycetota bacterium]
MRKSIRLSLAALAALGACAANPHQPPPDRLTRTFAVPIVAGQHTLELHVGNGQVTVAHGEAPHCDVSACVRAASPAEASRLASEIVLLPDPSDDGVQVVALRMPRPGSVEAVNLFVTVLAPPDLAVRVLTQRAAVVAQGYRGNLTVDTDSGDVRARLDGGSTDIRSRSGGVRVCGTFARAAVNSDSGPVAVVLAGGTPPSAVDVRTQGGDVTVEVPQASRVAFSARVRNGRNVPCELAAAWHEYGTDAGDRWRAFRGDLGAATVADEHPSKVSIESESGRVAVRCLPGT